MMDLVGPQLEGRAIHLFGDEVSHVLTQLLLLQASVAVHAVNLVDHKEEALCKALHQLGVGLLQLGQQASFLNGFQLGVVQDVDNSVNRVQQPLHTMSATESQSILLMLKRAQVDD